MSRVESSNVIGDIRRHLAKQPFVPFTIVTRSGQKYRVPTPEHAGMDPQSTRLVVWFDDRTGVVLAGLHVSALELEVSAPAA